MFLVLSLNNISIFTNHSYFIRGFVLFSTQKSCKSLRLFCYYFNDLDIKRIEADHSLLCPNTKESTEYDLWRLIGICNISVICNGFALEKARQDSTRAVTAYYRSIRKPEVLSFVMWQNKVKVNMDDSWRPKDKH